MSAFKHSCVVVCPAEKELNVPTAGQTPDQGDLSFRCCKQGLN